MTGMIWLTNVETAELIGLPLSKVLLIEQKRPQDGGAVAFYLDHGKEVQVSESMERVRECISEAKTSQDLSSRPKPMVTLAAG